MCTGAELHPRDAIGFDAHAPRHLSPVDDDREGVVAGLDVGDREMLSVIRVWVIVLAVGFGVRVWRLLRLGLDQAVDPYLLRGQTLGVPNPAREDPRPGDRTDPQLRIHGVAWEPLVRIDDEGRRVAGRDVNLEVQMIVRG